jgi:hypothetical protein
MTPCGGRTGYLHEENGISVHRNNNTPDLRSYHPKNQESVPYPTNGEELDFQYL